jgi:hypothetical protein
MFPLTIGGFSGDTMINIMMMTPQQKLFIAGYSWDKSLIDIIPHGEVNFYAYFDYSGT